MMARVMGLAVGVNRSPQQTELHYAENDAAGIWRTFVGGLGIVAAGDFACLLGARATRAAVLAWLRHAAAQQPDHFIFQFSGHGSKDGIRVADGFLSYADIARAFRRLAARKSLVIIDACHAAGFDDFRRREGISGPWGQAAAQILVLAATPGMRMMFSVGKGRLAGELADLRHGVFTYALLRAMHESAGDIELWGARFTSDSHVFANAARIANDLGQAPVSMNLRGDMPLVLSGATMEIGSASISLRHVPQGLAVRVVVGDRLYVPTVIRTSLLDARNRVVFSDASTFTPAYERTILNPTFPFPAGHVDDDIWCLEELRRCRRVGLVWVVSVEDQHGRILDCKTQFTCYAPGWGAGAALWIE